MTTIVLPVPVSPVSTVRPRSNSAVAVLIAPSDSIRISESTHCPRQPVTGSRNLRTSRSVNGALSSRTHFSGVPQRVTSSRPPAGTTISRRPSQNTSASWPSASISIAMVASGLVTIGRANSAWALLGTTRIASRSGHTIGPPAENAYAVEPVGVDTSTPSQPNADTGRPSTSSTDAEHAEPRALLQAGLVERPAAADDLAVDAHHDVERHAFLDAVVAVDDVVEDRVDGVGLGFGEESDAAQIDAQHRDLDVAGQLGGAQERAVTAEDEHELAALGRAFVGVDDLDIDAEGAHVVGRQMQRPAVDRLRGQHPQTDAVVAQHLFHPARRLGGLVAAGVHDEQDRAFSRHCGPSATARVNGAARARHPSTRWSARARSCRKYSTLPDGPGSGLAVTPTVCQSSSAARPATASTASARSCGIGHDAAGADLILADLELWLHHGNDIGVGGRA